jgi:O-antigen ligase
MRGRTTSETISTEGREVMVRNGIGLADARPSFGYGAGTSAQEAGLYEANHVLTIDNLYLSMLVEFGYVGVVLFIVFILTIVISGVKAAATRPGVERYMCLGLAAMVVGIGTGQIALSIQENLFFVHLAGGVFFAVLSTKRECPNVLSHAEA